MKSFSYSKFKTLSCPFKYAHQYIYRTPQKVDHKYTLAGIVFHEVLEKWLNEKVFLVDQKNARNILREMVREHFPVVEKKLEHSIGDLDGELQELIAMVDPTVDAMKKHGLLSRKMLTEFELRHSRESYLLYIRPDILTFKTGNSIILIDGKSSRSSDFLDHFQLEFYSRVLTEELGLFVDKAVFLMFRTGEVIEAKFVFKNNESFFEYLDKLVSRAEKIHEDPDAAKALQSNTCTFCGYKEVCPVKGKLLSGGVI